MTDTDPVVDNTWTTTQQKRLEDAKAVPENIVPDSHGNQKEFDVPCWVDRPDESRPIYEIPIELVSFNFNNVRIEKYKKHACSENDVDELDPTNEAHQQIVQDILLNAQDYSQKSSGDLAKGEGGLLKVGQREPALLTSTGVLWNGNRRCAIMRDLFDNQPTGEVGRLVRGKIRVCFLPEMTDDELRSLERRLQQNPDYKQAYGQITEMAKIQKEINKFEFEIDEGNATQEEQEAILEECKSSNFPTWEKVRNGKKMIDLMDDYLESRNGLDPTQNLIGYYTLFESTGTPTFFEALRDLLYKQVHPWFTSHPEHGDADEMFDKWKEVMFASLQYRLKKYQETGEKKYIKETYTPVRKMEDAFEKASGDVTSNDPRDTTHLILQRIQESPIIREWDNLKSTEPEDIAVLVTETREVDGEQVDIGEAEHEANKRGQKNYEKLGTEPAGQLQELRDDLLKIVEADLERVGPNDVRITGFIEECREALTEIENKNNSDENENEIEDNQ